MSLSAQWNGLGAKAFAPATMGNMAVGFDVLGGTLSGVGDVVSLQIADCSNPSQSSVRIDSIEGCDGEKLPLVAEKNTAGKAIISLLKGENLLADVTLCIEKGIPLGSGLGGSAASAVAAVVALNSLLKAPLNTEQLLTYALEGEAVASGSKHADNVAPCLLGGVVAVLSVSPISVCAVPLPKGLSVAVVKPNVEIKTEEARSLLKNEVPKDLVVQQQARLAAFLLGCAQNNHTLIRENFKDDWIEPQRKSLIPHFDDVKLAAVGPGVLGASISGAGPAVFALCGNSESAQEAMLRMKKVYEAAQIPVEGWACEIPEQGAYVLSHEE